MNTLAIRMIGAARLDRVIYEEVEADSHANGQAITVVVLATLAGAVGAGVSELAAMAGVMIGGLLSWIVWVTLTLVIGTRLLPGRQTRTDFAQVLRTTGFSATPGLLRIFGVVPVIGWWVFAVATVAMLCAFVVAVRHAMDYESTTRALTVSVLGWAVHAVFFFGLVLTAH
jgi:hypothetical protein